MADDKLTIIVEAKDRASKVMKDLDGVFGELKNVSKGFFSGAGGLAKAGLSAYLKFGKVAATGLLGVAGAAGAAGGVLAKFAIDAAPLEQVRGAFNGIAVASGKSSDAMLAALKEGSMGMVSQRDLMLSYNKAAQLVSDDFANQLPDAMGMLSKVAGSTGQDMNFLLDSLVTGVGRMSPMILDNLGIQVSLADATQRASDMFGIQADQLTDGQKQAGLMAEVMDKLGQNTASMPEATGTAAQAWGEFNALIVDLKDAIGTGFLPVLVELGSQVLPIMRQGLEKVQEVLPLLQDAFTQLFSGDLVASAQNFQQVLLGLGVPPEVVESLTINVGRIIEAFDRIKEAANLGDISFGEMIFGVVTGAVETFAGAMESLAEAVEIYNGLKDQILEITAKLSEISGTQALGAVASGVGLNGQSIQAGAEGFNNLVGAQEGRVTQLTMPNIAINMDGQQVGGITGGHQGNQAANIASAGGPAFQ